VSPLTFQTAFICHDLTQSLAMLNHSKFVHIYEVKYTTRV